MLDSIGNEVSLVRALMQTVEIKPPCSRDSSRVLPYILIARVDHWFKNVFVLPGVLFAVLVDPAVERWELIWRLPLGLLAVCLAASSNYVINEILDAPRDRLHPLKGSRPVPSGQIHLGIARAEWIVLGAISLGMAFALGQLFGLSIATLLLAGILYNLPPVRTKDVAYLDVISESVNNPIRFAAGWYATGSLLLPPISLLLAYWALGAFLMGVKRFAEYRHLANPALAAAYRSSFRHYNESRLLISLVFYATACGMFGGIFIARYHLELVLSVPAFAVFMGVYMRIGFKPNSPAQQPERLLRSRSMVFASLVFTLIVGFSLWLDSPALRRLFTPSIPAQRYATPAPEVLP